MSKLTRLVIADDHPLFRAGLRLSIEKDTAFKIVGEASDGAQAMRLIEAELPDLAILDINMPQLSGFDVVNAIQRRKLSVDVVMLTMHRDEPVFSKALALGVKGYVLKDGAVGDIIRCLHAVRDGKSYVSPELTDFLFKKASGKKDGDGIGSLTPTERTILRLIADYKTSRQIADELFVSIKTVENHRTNISSKLDVHGSHALIKFALQHISDI